MVGGTVVVAEVVGDVLVGHVAEADVETEQEPGVILEGALVAFAGDFEGVGHGRIGESFCGGAGAASGHVGDAVVDDSIDDIGGIGVGGGTGGLEAASLVDGDVDDDRAGLHFRDHFFGH